MPKVISIQVKNDHTAEAIAAMKQQALLALEAIGQEAEGYAKEECPVDTGLLRNSIAHGLGGEKPSIGSSYKGTSKKARTYKSENSGNKGTYSGTLPKDKEGQYSVYIGTNVDYAIYVEYGEKAAHTTGNAHFLRNSVTNHVDHYKQILEAALKA